MYNKINVFLFIGFFLFLSAITANDVNKAYGQTTTTICPGSPIECTVKTGDMTVWSQKDKDAAAVVIKKQKA